MHVQIQGLLFYTEKKYIYLNCYEPDILVVFRGHFHFVLSISQIFYLKYDFDGFFSAFTAKRGSEERSKTYVCVSHMTYSGYVY